MTLFATLLALVLEQFRPASVQWLRRPFLAWAAWLADKLNDGQYRHGVLAWCLAAALPALIVQGIYLVLMIQHPALGTLLACGVLYCTLGFRQFSHSFTAATLALRLGDTDSARRVLAQWLQIPTDQLGPNALARLAIEAALVDAHRHVFAPLFAFAAIGPGGALLYRFSLLLYDYWQPHPDLPGDQFAHFSRRVFIWIEWLPTRLTSLAFAAVGDFEDAIYCWRHQSPRWPEPTTALLITAGAGALGVRLGLPVHGSLSKLDAQARPEAGLGDEADTDYMQSTVGLVWRTLMLCLLITVLVWVAGWVV